VVSDVLINTRISYCFWKCANLKNINKLSWKLC